ncbi:MAG TPA: hypothetical protein PL033_04685 [Candidatus Brocadiia bacterium]|nr:hypothetical protein [Candidatus Brocadiia bacterium]
MKKPDWRISYSFFLIALSALFYALHFRLFHDSHHIFLYLVGDIAFLPLDVLIVTLILHGVLERREKRAMLSKLNMVIGAFFSEVGTQLLASLREFDPDRARLREAINGSGDLTKGDTAAIKRRLTDFDYATDAGRGDLAAMRDFLVRRRQFMLDLLGNPNLLEHETFTELLWAVFHLTEELAFRQDLSSLPESDLKHISGDVSRIYRLLVAEWLDYMQHLKRNYPYLFSLAMRTNPFDPEAMVVVR